MFFEKSRFLLFPALLLVSGASRVTAQDNPIDLLPPEVQSEVNSSLSNVLNALHVFSSSDSVSSGYFTFDEDNGPDTDLDVIKIAGDYKFRDSEDDSIVPFAAGLIGHVKLTGDLPPIDGIGQNDFVRFESTGLGLGGGVDLNLVDRFHIVPKMLFVYSQSKNEYDYNNQTSQTVLALFDGDLFNWDVDTVTYLPSLQAYYVLPLGPVTLQPSVQFSYINVDSVWTNSDLLDVKTETEILLTKLNAEIPLDVEVAALPLELNVFGARHDIYGDAVDAIGFNSYHEVGGVLYALSDGKLPFLSKLGLGSSYSWNSNFDGWRVGLQGEF